MEYDDLLKLIGQFGPQQKLLFFYGSFLAFMSATNILDMVFVLAVPGHICSVLRNATADVAFGYQEYSSNYNHTRLPIPTEERDGKLRYSQCSRYDLNLTWLPPDGDTVGYNSTLQPVAPCEKWTYDRSQTLSSLATKLDLVCEKKWLVSTAYTISMAGFIFGAFVFGNLADRIGRRKTILMCVLGVSISKVATTFAQHYLMYVIFKFALTACNIAAYILGFVLCVEMVGPAHRVIAGMVFMYFYTLGYVVLAGVAYLLRDSFYIQLTFAVPYVCIAGVAWFLPESIRWLYANGRVDEAEALVFKIAKRNGTLDKLPTKINVRMQNTENAFFTDLFRTPQIRKRTLYSMFIWFTLSVVYYGLSLNSGSIGGDIYLNFFIAGLVELPAYALSHLILKYVGRRIPFFATLLLSGLFLLSCIPVPSERTYVLLTLTMLGKFCITAAFNLAYIFTSELNPTVVRSIGMSTASTSARIGGMFAPLIGNLGDIKRFLPMLIFGGLAVVAAILALLLPETKDKPLPNTVREIEESGSGNEYKFSAIFKKGKDDRSAPEAAKFMEANQENGLKTAEIA